MHRTFIWSGFLSVGMAILAGCGTTPPPPHQETSASYVGDRASVPLEEVMVAVPVEGAHQVYQNLHVGLDAIVNVRGAASSYTGQAVGIVQRLEPRVAAAVLKAVTDGNTLAPHKLGALRETISARAQAVVKETLAQWSHGEDYEVELVVVSLYLTDSTVGRSQRVKERWQNW